MFYPIAIDIPPTEYTQKFYENVLTLEDGDIMLVDAGMYGYNEREVVAAAFPTFDHIYSQADVKVVWYCTAYGTTPYIFKFMKELYGDFFWDKMDEWPFYGTKLVYLGYVPGEYAAQHAMAEDFQAFISYDNFGKAKADLPLLLEINDGSDIKMCYAMGAHPHGGIAAWTVKWGVPYIKIGGAGIVSFTIDLYRAELLSGFVAGVKGGVEYEGILLSEGIIDTPGKSSAYMTAIILIAVYGIGGMILNNAVRRLRPTEVTT